MEQNRGLVEGKVTWKVASETIISLGTARAVLMQLAHPLVAAGVYEHSRFMTDPIGRALQTFQLEQFLMFGNSTQSRHAARTINRLHHHVHGTLKSHAGQYSVGTRYDAHDPALLLWVFATLVDTILLTYPLFIQPLQEEAQERYYQENKQVARMMGIPSHAIPEDLAQLRAYVHSMVYSEQLAATPESRELAQAVLYPPINDVLRPLMHLNQYVTSALLPEPIRQIFDLPWSHKRQQLFDISTATLRTVVPHIPMALRVLPMTRRLINAQRPA